MLRLKVLFILGLFLTNVSAVYEQTNSTLGNVSIQTGIWNTNINGTISNVNNSVDTKTDLGFTEQKNITSFVLDLKNNVYWLPNVQMNYFLYKDSAHNTLAASKIISNDSFNGQITSEIKYSELNTILYGFLNKNIFTFDIGVNIKNMIFKESISAVSGISNVDIKGTGSFLLLPYIALEVDLDFINTVLKAESSVLSIGDTEAKDYKYSISYRVMKHMFISYGYRYNGFRSKNSNTTNNEKYDMNIKGNYLNVKILF